MANHEQYFASESDRRRWLAGFIVSRVFIYGFLTAFALFILLPFWFMIVTSLKPDGSLEWSNVVAKDQNATATVASLSMFGMSGGGNFNVAIGISLQLGVMGKGPEYLSAIPIYSDGQLNIYLQNLHIQC